MVEHPLFEHPDWYHYCPTIGVITDYTLRIPNEGSKTRSFHWTGQCREDLISYTRRAFAAAATKAGNDWREPRESVGEISLGSRRALLYVKYPPEQSDRKVIFNDVANCVLGIPSVLFNPNRPQGRWWRKATSSQLKRAPYQQNSWLWAGSDNWFFQHPATLSVVSGLLKQVYDLVVGGFGDQILSSVKPQEVEEVLTTGNLRKALSLAGQLRPWIEVPPTDFGDRDDYPFPTGTWRRFIRFQRAVRRHGYEKVLGQDFKSGWNILESDMSYLCTGAMDFWGDIGELDNPEHRRVIRLGAPRKRKA